MLGLGLHDSCMQYISTAYGTLKKILNLLRKLPPQTVKWPAKGAILKHLIFVPGGIGGIEVEAEDVGGVLAGEQLRGGSLVVHTPELIEQRNEFLSMEMKS